MHFLCCGSLTSSYLKFSLFIIMTLRIDSHFYYVFFSESHILQIRWFFHFQGEVIFFPVVINEYGLYLFFFWLCERGCELCSWDWTWTLYVAQDDLKFLPQPPKCWNYRYMSYFYTHFVKYTWSILYYMNL